MIQLKKMVPALIILLASGLVWAPGVLAHCQIPCGIYDDYARVLSMLEDTATIEKAVNMLEKLEKDTGIQAGNQRVRWIMNKEKHAQKIIQTISDYFLTQRVKPGYKDYSQRLEKHHKVMISAMKAKQNTDMDTVNTLKKDIQALKSYYPEHEH